MLRVSPEQYSLLKRNAEGKPVLRAPGTKRVRVKKRAEDLPENQLEKLVTDYLRHHGWICTKQHAGFFKRFVGGKMTGFTIGEKGQADWRAERPVIPPGSRLSKTSCFRVELFYFETKAPAKSQRPISNSGWTGASSPALLPVGLVLSIHLCNGTGNGTECAAETLRPSGSPLKCRAASFVKESTPVER